MTAAHDIVGLIRARLANRADSEHKQVLVRIAITALFSLYLGLDGSANGGGELHTVWLILLGQLILSVGLLGAILHALPPREASEMLVSKARQRARGGGDNLSLALVRVEPLET